MENYTLGPPDYKSSALSTWPVPLALGKCPKHLAGTQAPSQHPKHLASTLSTQPLCLSDGVNSHKNVPVIFRLIFNLKLLFYGIWEEGCIGLKLHCHCKFTVVNNDNASLKKEKKNDLLGKKHFRKVLLILVCIKFFQYKVKTNSEIIKVKHKITWDTGL